jgi:hypothetical protein
MELTKTQKNVLTVGGVGLIAYLIYKSTRPKKPPNIGTLKDEEKLLVFIYDYFQSIDWLLATDSGSYIKPYVSEIEKLNRDELDNLVKYYVDNYSKSTNTPLLSTWIDNQVWSMYLFDDPFAGTIKNLEIEFTLLPVIHLFIMELI